MLHIKLLSVLIAFITLTILMVLSLPTATQADEHPLSAIGLRSIGPALTSIWSGEAAPAGSPGNSLRFHGQRQPVENPKQRSHLGACF